MLTSILTQNTLPGFVCCESCGLASPVGAEILHIRRYIGGRAFGWVTACESIDDCFARQEIRQAGRQAA